MNDERLSGLAVLSNHLEGVNELDLDKVIDKFAVQSPHCRIYTINSKHFAAKLF